MKQNQIFWVVVKILVFITALSPFAWMVWDTVQDKLGPDPIETLHFRSGDWTLRFLMLTLTCTPLKLLFNWNFQHRFRRMLGLFTFFYATVHLSVYLALDLSFSWEQMVDEIPDSPYVLVGLAAYILLLPLALTSTRKMVQRLGRNWKKLHRLIYVIAVLGVIHFLWLVKEDLREPLIYAAVLTFLLGTRMVFAIRSKNTPLRFAPALRNLLFGKA